MNIEPWEIIASINDCLKPLREADSPAIIATLDLVALRNKVRAQLDRLRSNIIELYSERAAYFVLFPLTAHCDELVKKMILDINHLEWPSLQQELYQVADGGDLFYELLDTVLGKPETLPLVYEVYYFCLSDGFCGRYATNPDRIADYLKKLHQHIILPTLPPSVAESPTLKKWSNLRIRNRVYYGTALTLLILFYCFLTFLASTWQPTGLGI